LRILVLGGGSAALAAFIALAVTQAPLGSPLFFGIVAIPCIVYALVARRLLSIHEPGLSGLLIVALAFAAAFRAPLLVRAVDAKSDMVRYIYDGRLQRLGYNPYLVVPADPAMAATHTDETRQMPSIGARTPYPAAAQWFFRLVVTIHESSRAMKLALAACDLLTIAVLVAWLTSTNRSPWLALMYAWNPLVILEVAHSGHIDALGALWIAVCAWMLSTGRGMRAAVAFVLAVATKLLPIVLLPLFWKRIRIRDAIAGAIALTLLYLPFASAGTLPLGAVPNVVAYIRFNGPLFKFLAWLLTPKAAAGIAVLAGLAVSGWMRMNTSADDPAAWGWPMAVSLACAPVVYPWYLLYLTPFLFARSCWALVAWTFTALPVYAVWDLARHGHRWFVPAPIQWIEYGVVIAVTFVGSRSTRGRR
jgi:alpha-1,6-mannosyltransferase